MRYRVTVVYEIDGSNMISNTPEDAEFIILHNAGQPGIRVVSSSVKAVAD